MKDLYETQKYEIEKTLKSRYEESLKKFYFYDNLYSVVSEWEYKVPEERLDRFYEVYDKVCERRADYEETVEVTEKSLELVEELNNYFPFG